ncbi:hypothetical protein GCM10023320_49440 [Pseudonocardia adelaidensis]|uniref:Major facilitator superfamily (MFS) profile domain-containing protein n=1 Tax=Pseudonocardia adelaidensis TaxID=648754 RepID=A0ABP9NPA4_9PSEU
MVTAGMTVALLTGVPAGTWFAGAQGWRATFWLLAGLGICVAVGVMLTAPDIPGGEPASLANRLGPLRSLPVARLVAATFLCGAGGMMFYSYLAPVTAALANGSYQLLSIVLLVVGVVGIGGVVLGGRSTDAWGPRRARQLAIGGHGGALLLVAVFAFRGTRSAVVFAVLVAVWSVFAWALNPPMQASVLAAAPHAGMTAMALNISALYLGTGVAGVLGGAIVDLTAANFVPLAGGVLLLIALFFASLREHRTRASPVTPDAPAHDSAPGH